MSADNMATVGGVKVEIIGDTSKLEAAVEKAKRSQQEFSTNVQKNAQAFRELKSAIEVQAASHKAGVEEQVKATRRMSAEMEDMVDAIKRVEEADKAAAKAAKDAAKEHTDAAEDAIDALGREKDATEEVTKTEKELAREKREAQRAAQTAAREAEQAARRHKRGLEEIATVAAVLFAILATGIGLAVVESAKMEQSLANLKAVTGATASELERAKAAAEDFGPSSGIMAPESVRVIEEFSKAGVEYSRLINGELKDAQDLMVAGELNVAEAAGTAAYALNAYHKEGLKLKEVADIQVGAANASATSVKEMADANRMLGPVAAQLGETYKDVNTTLAIFAQNGLRGSDAGTSLKTAMLQLTAPTDEQRRVMDDLNLKFFDSTGKMKSMAEISEMLQTKLAKYNDEARMLILSTLAGTDGVRALSIMAESGAEAFEEMSQKMSKVTAAETAATRLETLQGQMKILTAEVGVAADRFAGNLLPAITAVAEGFTALIKGYNDMDPASQGLITNIAVTGTAMAGTLAALTLLTLGVGKLSKAVGGLTGALNLLRAHPVILALTLLAGVVTAVTVAYQQHEEAARKAAVAQDEYNKKVQEGATTKDVGRYAELKAEAQQIQELGKRYDELAQKKARLSALGATSNRMSFAGLDSDELRKATEEMKKIEEQLLNLGATAENYEERVRGLTDSLEQNTRMVLDSIKPEVDKLAAMQDSINKIDEAKRTYEDLTAKTSLNAEEQANLTSAVNTLKGQIPGLNVLRTEEGKLIITNTNLIHSKSQALKFEKQNSQDTAMATLVNERAKAEATIKSAELQINAIRAVAAARAALDSKPGPGGARADAVLPDNVARRDYIESETRIGNLNTDKAAAEAALAEADNMIGMIKNGTAFSVPTSGGGGGMGYTVPDPPKKDKKDDEEDRKMREAFNKRLEQERQALDTGVINRMVYVQRLQGIEADFSGWLANNESERNQIRNDQWSEHFRYSSEWIEDRKRQMQDAGMSDQQVAEEEIKAWERVLSRTNLMAEDRKRAEEELRRARMDARGADMEHSLRWIEEEKERMQDAGASEVEIAKMVYDAWTRVDSRRGTGRYNLEDEKRAADELKAAYQALTEVLEGDLRRARELDRDLAVKAAEEEIKLAEEVMQARHKGEIKAIQDKIDALDEQAKAEDRILQYQREQERLAELNDQRNKVADDKRFEIIEADENGVLAPKLVADPTRLAELDEDIKEQQAKLGEMRREDERNRRRKELEEDMEETRERHEKEAKELQKSNEEKMAALRSFWEGQLREEKLTSDLRNAIVKDGLETTKSNVETYLKGMVDSYAQAQAEIQALGGLIGASESSSLIPSTRTSTGSIAAPSGGTSGGYYDYRKDTRVFKNGQYVGDPSMTPEEYSKKLPKAHTGLKRVPGAPGQESDYKLIAGERVLSAAQNDGLDAFLRRAATWTSPAEAIMRTMTYQPPAPAPSRQNEQSGQSVSIDTGGAPLIAIYPTPGMDVQAIGDEVDRRVDRRFAEIGFKMGNR